MDPSTNTTNGDCDSDGDNVDVDVEILSQSDMKEEPESVSSEEEDQPESQTHSDLKSECLFCLTPIIPPPYPQVGDRVSVSLQLENELKTVFILRHVLEFPRHILEMYLMTHGSPEGWIKVCKGCNKKILHIKWLFDGKKKMRGEFEDARKRMRRIIWRACTKGLKPGKIPRRYVGSLTTDPNVPVNIVEECRRWVCMHERNLDSPDPEMPHLQPQVIPPPIVHECGEPLPCCSKSLGGNTPTSTTPRIKKEMKESDFGIGTVPLQTMSCSLCGDQKPQTIPVLANHIQQEHLNEFRCIKCHKEFLCFDGSAITRHWCIHHDRCARYYPTAMSRVERVYPIPPLLIWFCPLCPNLIFLDESWRDSHWNNCPGGRNVDGRVAVCIVCRKEYRTTEELMLHSVTTHPDFYKRNPFKCGLCRQGFETEDRVRSHRIQVHKMNPYQCDVCGKNFYTKEDYESH